MAEFETILESPDARMLVVSHWLLRPSAANALEAMAAAFAGPKGVLLAREGAAP